MKGNSRSEFYDDKAILDVLMNSLKKNAWQHPNFFPTYSSVTQQPLQGHHLNWQGDLKVEHLITYDQGNLE